jgi:hypothetical protein
MIAIVGLFVLLMIPLAAWIAVRWWPSRQKRPKAQGSGPRHRWWQP